MNKEALSQVVGSAIKEISGTVTKLWPRKSGGEGEKVWTVQNGEFDIEGGSVKLVIWNHDDLAHLVGKSVTFKSKQGPKGLSGVKVSENTYKDVTSLQVEIGSGVLIEQGVAMSAPTNVSAPASASPSTQQSQPVTPPRSAAFGARYTVSELLNLYQYIASDPRVDTGNIDVTQRAVASVFIAATKDGLKVPQE